MISPHTVAIISLIGSSLDVLGSLYLAYDLLGGEHGPLRTLTRAVTYSLLFGIGYGIFLGPVFGITSGAAHGFTIAHELARTARGCSKPGFWYDVVMSSIRGLGYAIGGTLLFGAPFGITFGVLSAVGQVVAYRAGIRPSIGYAPASRLGITRLQVLAGLNRTVGYALTGYISALAGNHRDKAVVFGLEAGLVVGLVTVVAGSCTPLVEWIALKMPTKRMGVIGVGLILVGFLLQSVQNWVTLINTSH